MVGADEPDGTAAEPSAPSTPPAPSRESWITARWRAIRGVFRRETLGKDAVAGTILGVESVPDGLAIGAQGFGMLNELDRLGFDVRADEPHRPGATRYHVMKLADATIDVCCGGVTSGPTARHVHPPLPSSHPIRRQNPPSKRQERA